MGRVANSWDTILTPPPPPPPSSSKSNMPMLYYGLVIVGTTAIVLVIYNLIVVRWCTRQHLQSQSAGANRFSIGMIRGRGLEISNRNLLSSFRYKKEAGVQTQEQQDSVDYECSVCLSVFEEGEEVKILPRCKHSFHAACIDMWLYSHFDCPLCRATVRPLCHRLQVRDSTRESSQEGLMDPDNAV